VSAQRWGPGAGNPAWGRSLCLDSRPFCAEAWSLSAALLRICRTGHSASRQRGRHSASPARGRSPYPPADSRGNGRCRWWSLGLYEGALRQLCCSGAANPTPAQMLCACLGRKSAPDPAWANPGNARIVAISQRGSKRVPSLPQLDLPTGLGYLKFSAATAPATLGQQPLNRAIARAQPRREAFRLRPVAMAKPPGWAPAAVLIVR